MVDTAACDAGRCVVLGGIGVVDTPPRDAVRCVVLGGIGVEGTARFLLRDAETIAIKAMMSTTPPP